MTSHRHPPHQLLGRSEQELAWFQRRSLLQAAALWVASGGWAAAHAQGRSNIVELRGDVLRAQGKTEEAVSAYQDALTHLDATLPSRGLVELKLADLGAPASKES